MHEQADYMSNSEDKTHNYTPLPLFKPISHAKCLFQISWLDLPLHSGPTEFYSGNWSIWYAVWEIPFFFIMTSLKQHIEYFYFRSKIQLDHPVLEITQLMNVGAHLINSRPESRLFRNRRGRSRWWPWAWPRSPTPSQSAPLCHATTTGSPQKVVL